MTQHMNFYRILVKTILNDMYMNSLMKVYVC